MSVVQPYYSTRELTQTSVLAFMAAIALDCFFTWDEPTFIATTVVWGTSTILAALCALTLWEGSFLRNGTRVPPEKISVHKIDPMAADDRSSPKVEVSEENPVAVHVVVGTKV